MYQSKNYLFMIQYFLKKYKKIKIEYILLQVYEDAFCLFDLKRQK